MSDYLGPLCLRRGEAPHIRHTSIDDTFSIVFLCTRLEITELIEGEVINRPPQLDSQDNHYLSAMGQIQSSRIEDVLPAMNVPGTLLDRANSGELTAECLAETYSLGLGDEFWPPERSNHGFSHDLQIGRYVAIDCEMVGVGSGGTRSALARVSLVDFHGRQVYDSFVQPQESVTDWRANITGIGPLQMYNSRGFDVVQPLIAEILKGRILVGHDLRHDLSALRLRHPLKDTRDTATLRYLWFHGNGGKPSLRTLSREMMGHEMQRGVHSSIEDARVAMAIFRLCKPEFDRMHAKTYAHIAWGFDLDTESTMRAVENLKNRHPTLKTRKKKGKARRTQRD